MSKLVGLTCLLALGGALLCAQSTLPPVVATTGMVGLAEGQTARLNLLNPGVLAPAIGVVCTAGVAFVDATGAVLKSATLTIAPGKSDGLNLDSQADLSLAADERKEIRAVITVPAAPPTASGATVPAACKVIPTLELYDTLSGRTLVVLGHTEIVPAVN
jgi:hypothetical protein